MIKLGSIKYYALIELGQKLNNSDYKNLGLEHLDRLSFEVQQKIKEIKNNKDEQKWLAIET